MFTSTMLLLAALASPAAPAPQQGGKKLPPPVQPGEPGVRTAREAAAAGLAALGGDDAAAELGHRAPPTTPEERLERIHAALRFLEGQQKDGRLGFGEAADPGVTALALSAVVRTCDENRLPRPAWVAKGFDYLLSLQKADGAIYETGLQNYITSASAEAMAVAGDERFVDPLSRALAYLQSGQFDEGEGFSAEEDPYYGGFGYGSPEHPEQDPNDHPDMSNTQMALQAMKDAGVAEDDEAFQKAVKFLERCQNLPETGAPPKETGDGKVIVPGDDGGGTYRPSSSKAGLDDLGDGRFSPRSYGSMTYALLKCYLFAGIDPADERVQAAIRWIRSNYTLDENPGFQDRARNTQYQGLYYYYLTLARALGSLGEDTLTDSDGVSHAWRDELEAKLFSMQAEDGHWVNDRSTRWMEGNPSLTTSYALMALCETR